MRARPASVLFLLLAGFSVCGAQTPDYARRSNAQLINQLRHVHTFAPGLHPNAGAYGFLAVDDNFGFGGGVLGSLRPVADPAMREFVRRGAAALPTLISNLNNATPTELTIRDSSMAPADGDPPSIPVIFTAGEFIDYYDPKIPLPPGQDLPTHRIPVTRRLYTVKVGDVCFVLIGQIVNRNLNALRYRPSGIVLIDSPIVQPALIDLVKADWQDADAATLRDSLIDDARTPASPNNPRSNDALVRLRFYFPTDYQKLKSGDLYDRIAAFENARPDPPPAPSPVPVPAPVPASPSAAQ
jgi:hypothetical protein